METGSRCTNGLWDGWHCTAVGDCGIMKESLFRFNQASSEEHHLVSVSLTKENNSKWTDDIVW